MGTTQTDKNDKIYKNDKRPVKITKNTDEMKEPEYDVAHVVSANDCTGMTYAPPQSEEEFDEYKDMFNLPIKERNDTGE